MSFKFTDADGNTPNTGYTSKVYSATSDDVPARYFQNQTAVLQLNITSGTVEVKMSAAADAPLATAFTVSAEDGAFINVFVPHAVQIITTGEAEVWYMEN
jgi:hypothetical protein